MRHAGNRIGKYASHGIGPSYCTLFSFCESHRSTSGPVTLRFHIPSTLVDDRRKPHLRYSLRFLYGEQQNSTLVLLTAIRAVSTFASPAGKKTNAIVLSVKAVSAILPPPSEEFVSILYWSTQSVTSISTNSEFQARSS
jgi:hypothetical protein